MYGQWINRLKSMSYMYRRVMSSYRRMRRCSTARTFRTFANQYTRRFTRKWWHVFRKRCNWCVSLETTSVMTWSWQSNKQECLQRIAATRRLHWICPKWMVIVSRLPFMQKVLGLCTDDTKGFRRSKARVLVSSQTWDQLPQVQLTHNQAFQIWHCSRQTAFIGNANPLSDLPRPTDLSSLSQEHTEWYHQMHGHSLRQPPTLDTLSQVH